MGSGFTVTDDRHHRVRCPLQNAEQGKAELEQRVRPEQRSRVASDGLHDLGFVEQP